MHMSMQSHSITDWRPQEVDLQQEGEHLVVLDQRGVIHNHGQGPGHPVVQPEGQQLSHVTPGASFTTAAGP